MKKNSITGINIGSLFTLIIKLHIIDQEEKNRKFGSNKGKDKFFCLKGLRKKKFD